ncbi:MAG: aldehyde ferredoxin oxidoreductase C-terminal domain-containing protein, partial [Haloarculaceae archaeon]
MTTRDRLLRVDLSSHTAKSERVPDSWRRKFVGGKGLGARYLYEELPPGADALGPENVLFFGLGPVSGLLPGENRFAAVTKSPLTGTFLDSYAGGSFPPRLAGGLEGHLGLLVEGVAEDPVRIEIEDGAATVEPATTWGAETPETCRAHDGAVACIGPAGEQRVAYATIASDGGEHHAGRGGAGAVMGSKRLKAVVARGEQPTGSEDLREQVVSAYRDHDVGKWQAASGTVETVDFADETDVLAAMGWRERGFEGADGIGIEAIRERADEREGDGPFPGDFRVETDEGETVPRGATAMTLGAGLGLEEFDAVAELGERCNSLGLDLISGGNAIALAFRLAEAGVLFDDAVAPDLLGDGLLAAGLAEDDLAFGDPAGARALLEAIATRSGPLADTLAEGVGRAASELDAEGYIPTVKTMALPAYDPRGSASMALAYATSDRGACHRRARPVEREAFDGPWEPETVAEAVIEAQNTRSLRWSLVADDFVGEVVEAAAWLDAVGAPTGDLDLAGERIWNLVRLFNVREGFD